jgi:SAM-dependent methyltransferase
VSREHWDERYGVPELVWTAEPNRFLVEEVGPLSPGRALDLACGEGRNALWLASRGWQVTGVDFSRVGLDKARLQCTNLGLEVNWVEADVVEWTPPAASFDLVLVLYLHLPSAQRRKALAQAKRALSPGGVLLVVGHDSSNILHGAGGPKDPAVLYRLEEIAEDISGLEIVRAQRVTRNVVTDDGEATAIDALIRAVHSRQS